MKDLYTDFYDTTSTLTVNIVCASCGIIDHDPAVFENVDPQDESLSHLSVSPDVYVPFDFSCGVSALDDNRIMIDPMGVTQAEMISTCRSCYVSLQRGFCPQDSLANFRWLGSVPPELQGLTWLEELLIARAHLVGRIVRLEERRACSYFALKGHTILLPQDTTQLLNLLPMSLSSLPDIVRVVWTGKDDPEKRNLRPSFTVRKQKVYTALQWLCQNHEDYRHVTIDEERIASWEATTVATELLESMGRTSDSSTEDASRSGFANEDPDSSAVEGDIPHSVSGVLDLNNVTRASEVNTLEQLASLQNGSTQQDLTINVVTGTTILNDFEDPTYFTSAFPTLFPYGTGKHLDTRRPNGLSLSKWAQLLLKHSSRYNISLQLNRADVQGGFKHIQALWSPATILLDVVTT
jgi:hypothetical protein